MDLQVPEDVRAAAPLTPRREVPGGACGASAPSWRTAGVEQEIVVVTLVQSRKLFALRLKLATIEAMQSRAASTERFIDAMAARLSLDQALLNREFREAALVLHWLEGRIEALQAEALATVADDPWLRRITA